MPIWIHLLFHVYLLKSLAVYIYHYLSSSPSSLRGFTDLCFPTALTFNQTKVMWENTPLKIHGKSDFLFIYFESWCRAMPSWYHFYHLWYNIMCDKNDISQNESVIPIKCIEHSMTFWDNWRLSLWQKQQDMSFISSNCWGILWWYEDDDISQNSW